MNDHVVDYRASYIAARRAIIQARSRLAKGRALWNGPAHECDNVLSAFLDGPIFPDDPRDAQIADLRAALQWFLDDPRFQVGVGGNPRVVMRMISDARAALAATEPKP